MIDTHCHLFMEPLASDVDGVLARAHEVGVREFVIPAYDRQSWSAVQNLGRRDGVHPALGLHPWVADQVATAEARPAADAAGPTTRNKGSPGAAGAAERVGAFEPMTATEFKDHLAASLKECRAVALGEIGLDFIVLRPSHRHQLAVLKLQLELAADLDLPVILHCRNGWEMLVGALQGHAGRIRGVMHAYTRHPELAGPFLKCGFYVGLGGAITQPQAKRARRSAEALPLGRILLETDAPASGLDDIEPERTEPRHLHAVAETLAEIRGTSIEHIAEVTTDNAREFFRI